MELPPRGAAVCHSAYLLPTGGLGRSLNIPRPSMEDGRFVRIAFSVLGAGAIAELGSAALFSFHAVGLVEI